jgi:hypothetical protein
MVTYGFRLRFNLPSGSAVQEKSEELELLRLPDGRPLILHAVSADSIADCAKLSVGAGGFASEQEARTCGEQVRNALMVCGASCRIGIDVGQDKATSHVGKIVRDSYKEAGIRLLDDVHGLSVFPEDLPVRFFSMSGTVILGHPGEGFVSRFREAFQSAPELSDRQTLSLQLYAASKFEASLRARFVTLVSGVEALAERELEDPQIVDQVNRLIQATRQELEPPARHLLASRLGELRYWSISRACKELVARHLGSEEAGVFDSAYDVRSKILHEGRVPAGTDLGRDCTTLDRLVSDLLLTICTT